MNQQPQPPTHPQPRPPVKEPEWLRRARESKSGLAKDLTHQVRLP